jgi:hypothetical protein
MAEIKTKPTNASVKDFLEKVSDERRRKDCDTIVQLMSEATKAPPQMWGSSIVGFGRYHYKYASGHEGEFTLLGFSPRKTELTLYITPGLHLFPELLSKLGKFKTGRSCLYIKKLDDVNIKVLRRILHQAVKAMAKYRVD